VDLPYISANNFLNPSPTTFVSKAIQENSRAKQLEHLDKQLVGQVALAQTDEEKKEGLLGHSIHTSVHVVVPLGNRQAAFDIGGRLLLRFRGILQ